VDYVVLFDVASKTRPWLLYVTPSIVLVIIVVLFVRLWNGKEPPEFIRGADSLFNLGASALVLAVWMTLFVSSYESDRHTMVDALWDGRVARVEGVASVEVEKGCFSVREQRFCSSQRRTTPAFNKPVMFSGIQSGSLLRVSYVANDAYRYDVLRLEIAAR
jgi:hypothetical protein